MNRIAWFPLNGQAYPLTLSMQATRRISERFGGLEQVADAMSGMGVDDALEVSSWLLALLMQQGFAYCDLTGEARPEQRFTQEELEILLQPSDLPQIQGAILGAMSEGISREVHVEDGGKNEETTQG